MADRQRRINTRIEIMFSIPCQRGVLVFACLFFLFFLELFKVALKKPVVFQGFQVFIELDSGVIYFHEGRIKAAHRMVNLCDQYWIV